MKKSVCLLLCLLMCSSLTVFADEPFSNVEYYYGQGLYYEARDELSWINYDYLNDWNKKVYTEWSDTLARNITAINNPQNAKAVEGVNNMIYYYNNHLFFEARDEYSWLPRYYMTDGQIRTAEQYFSMITGKISDMDYAFEYKSYLREAYLSDNNSYYFLYDLDDDGINELFVQQNGATIGDEVMKVYTKKNNYIINYGSIASGGVEFLHRKPGEKGIVTAFCWQGYEKITRLELINGKITETETIMPLADFSRGDYVYLGYEPIIQKPTNDYSLLN